MKKLEENHIRTDKFLFIEYFSNENFVKICLANKFNGLSSEMDFVLQLDSADVLMRMHLHRAESPAQSSWVFSLSLALRGYEDSWCPSLKRWARTQAEINSHL